MRLGSLRCSLIARASRGLLNWPRRSDVTIETTEWNAADYLTSDEAISAYLDAAFEDGDPKVVAVALGNIAKAKGMTGVSREARITREALYKALSEKGDPKLSTLLGVIKALGLRFTVTVDKAA
jgi:probable addiction module antidote protein